MHRSIPVSFVVCVCGLLHAQAPDSAASLGFTPDPASAARVQQAVIARVAQANPQGAQALRRALAGKDVSALFAQWAAPWGLHDGNLADAITAEAVMKQMQQTGAAAPSPEQIQQQRAATARTLAAQPGAQTESKRREIAEIAQIGFIVEHLAWQQKQQNPAGGAAAPEGASSAVRDPGDAAAEGGAARGAEAVPVGAATQSAGSFSPMGSTLHVEAWYLYPGGIATNCSTHDAATLPISLPALRAMRDCTGARWRRVGGKVQLQESDRDAWSDAQEQPAMPAGTRIQFLGETEGGAGTMPGGAGVSVNTVDSGHLILTADGHIRTALSSGTAIGGAGIGGGGSHSVRLDGTYVINGYVMTITMQGGQSFHRLVTVVHEAGKVYVYFQDREYWPPGR